MKIGIIIQRFGHGVLGGAELHCRYVADRLRLNHDVEIITTTARDYLTWQNEFPSGPSRENDLSVVRFPIATARNVERYHELSYLVSHCPHSPADELAWLEEQGPGCPGLIDHLRRHSGDYDVLIFFSFRYATVFHGLAIAPRKSILVPTAENDRIIHLEIFRSLFHQPAAIAYNSIEEREMIQAITGNAKVPGEVVGVGLSEQLPIPSEELFRKFDLRRRFIVYVGRIEKIKGCAALADDYFRFVSRNRPEVDLVFLGRGDYRPPKHPLILHLADVSETEKLGIIAAAECLVLPSRFESLSMVLLEAMAMRTPFLANGECPVLRGQSIRSGGGLYYRNYDEFELALGRLIQDRPLARRMGEHGYRYYRENYNWSTIMAKYDRLLALVVQS